MTRFAVLTDRRLIQIVGPDWRSFLQGLISQDVESLDVGSVAYGALLTPQGRLLFDMFVWAEADRAILDVASSTREALLARLGMYRLRSKVTISDLDGAVYALFPAAAWSPGAPSGSPNWRVDPRVAALGQRAIGEAPPLDCAEVADLEAYHAHRIALGVPDFVRDGLSDKAYAVEADIDLLNGVDFSKGCFVGQETTSRMKRRGPIKTRICPLVFDGEPPGPGAEVLAAPKPEESSAAMRAGEVLSGCDGRALALLRLDRALDRRLSVDGRPVQCAPAAWLAPALTPLPSDAI